MIMLGAEDKTNTYKNKNKKPSQITFIYKGW